MVHVSDIMDCLPFELKLMIINYLPLDTVKAVMTVNSNLWHVSQHWTYWKNTTLTVNCENVESILENHTLSQPRLLNSTSVKVYCYGMSTEVANNLMIAIAASDVSHLQLCALYSGSVELLNKAINKVRHVDTSALFYIVRRNRIK